MGTLEEVCPYGCSCEHNGDHCHRKNAEHWTSAQLAAAPMYTAQKSCKKSSEKQCDWESFVSSPPPPPACFKNLGNDPGACKDQESKESCPEYFYKNNNNEWRQCHWRKLNSGQYGCTSGGFRCDRENAGQSNCKCTAQCPYQLPSLPAPNEPGANCKHQGANSGNCARCRPRRNAL